MLDPVENLTITVSQKGSYREQGYLIIENIVKEEAIQKIKSDILDIVNKQGIAENCPLKQTRRYVRNTSLSQYINSSHMKKIASQLLGGKANLYLPFTAVKSPGKDSSFNFHQDNNYTPHRGPSLNMWVAFEDMNVENGCLYIDPKSHLDGILESELVHWGGRSDKKVTQTNNPQPAIIKAGSCVAFDRHLIHGSGANTSDQHRVAYALQYSREDTEALIDDEWVLLADHPRWEEEVVACLDEI